MLDLTSDKVEITTMFERLLWHEDRILLDDLVFYLDRDKTEFEMSDRDGFFRNIVPLNKLYLGGYSDLTKVLQIT